LGDFISEHIAVIVMGSPAGGRRGEQGKGGRRGEEREGER
jgi:hypothetical protein